MGSPFASLVTSDPIPLPFDAGQWVKVRKLTGRQYESVQDAHRMGYASGGKWAGFFRTAALDPHSDEVQRILRDPLTGHDRYTLVQEGLVAWSYDRPIDKDAIADLDDDALDFIAREVLKLAKPGLFAEQTEAEKKSA